MNRTRLTWIVLGVIGWAGIAWLASSLGAGGALSAGFDLELLLEGGRRVAGGVSPYDPALVSGAAPSAPSLFYSYPPPVAQALSIVADVPSTVMLVAWDLGAIVGLVAVAEALRRRLSPARAATDVAVATFGIAPFILPFAVGLLFGNLDVYFPLLYGLMLLAAITPATGAAVRGGIGLGLAALKLHPASMGLWFAVRGAGERAAGRARWGWVTVATAVGIGLAILVVSLVAFGTGPWFDYASVVRAGSGADIVDPRNAAPAALVASVVGGHEWMARLLQVVVSGVALVVTAAVAWREPDPLRSLSVAAVASLVTLPVTWYHYPSALIPFGIAAILRADGTAAERRVVALVAGSVAVAAIAVAWLPALWLAVAALVAGVWLSPSGRSPVGASPPPASAPTGPIATGAPGTTTSG